LVVQQSNSLEDTTPPAKYLLLRGV